MGLKEIAIQNVQVENKLADCRSFVYSIPSINSHYRTADRLTVKYSTFEDLILQE